jgi:hypothetical protein
MVEPCVNPALERQAIGRVHRMGQKRVVKVWRLVMKDSIDEKIIQVTKRITDGGGSSGSGGGAAAASGDADADADGGAGASSPKRARTDANQVGSIARDHAASMRLEELEVLFS